MAYFTCHNFKNTHRQVNLSLYYYSPGYYLSLAISNSLLLSIFMPGSGKISQKWWSMCGRRVQCVIRKLILFIPIWTEYKNSHKIPYGPIDYVQYSKQTNNLLSLEYIKIKTDDIISLKSCEAKSKIHTSWTAPGVAGSRQTQTILNPSLPKKEVPQLHQNARTSFIHVTQNYQILVRIFISNSIMVSNFKANTF